MFEQSAEKWVVLVVIGGVLIGLLRDGYKPSLLFFAAVMILMLFGIADPVDLLTGLANQQILTVILLIVITSALRRNFDLEKILDKLFAKAVKPKPFLLRMSVSVAVISSFLNNTPVVAVMTPYVYSWSKEHGTHPSKLLIPLSYATILGGMLTMIGTSTNLILNGFLLKNDLPALGFDEFLYPGLMVTTLGIIYLVSWGYKLLPENKEAFDDVQAKAPEYLVETKVLPVLNGKSLKASGLGNITGVYLIEMRRGEDVISPVPAGEELQTDDSLHFMGQPDKIADLVNAGIGLTFPAKNKDQDIVEAVIPANSSLSGQTVDSARFKEKFHAELLAIHRNGEKISGNLHQRKLSQGDLLLISAGEGFMQAAEKGTDLYVLSAHKKEAVGRPKDKRYFIVGGLLCLTGILTGIVSLFVGLLLIFLLLNLFRMYSFRDAGEDTDPDLLTLLVCALAVGNIFIESGAAALLADNFIQVFLPMGKIGILIGLFILVVLLTSFVTNVAAVSIAFPIAYSLSTNPEMAGTGSGLFVAIAFAASSAFLTPVGYQTNWMVYGPGGYNNRDFLRVGFPLSLIYGISCILFIAWRYDFY